MGILRKLGEKIEEIRWEDAADPSRWVNFARGQIRLYFYILRELVRNRCPQQAAALTFTTLLSLVPLLAVAFSIFRAFAAMEGLADRAQDAIFEALLAGPLMERVESPELDVAPQELPATPADLTPAEALAAADSSRRSEAVASVLPLYLGALSRGADAQQVRDGMSVLHLRKARSVLSTEVRGLDDRAAAAYLDAAGLAAVGRGGLDARTPEGARHYDNAVRLLERGEHEEALDAARLAEEAGYPAIRSRRLMGQVHDAMANRSGRDGELRDAANRRQGALRLYCDAIVAGALTSTDGEDLDDALACHAQALEELGRAFFELGRWEANTYAAFEDRTGTEAATMLEAGVDDLTSAIGLLDHSSEVHHALAELLWMADRQDEARAEYVAAFEQGRAAAARGLSLAVVDYIRMFIDKVGRAEIGIIGVLFLLVTATSLLSTIENTLNQIWKVTKSRPFWIKFTSFCTLIWLGPALIGASIWAQERMGVYVETRLTGLPVIGSAVGVLMVVGGHLLPFVTTWLILVLLYKFLPHTRVKFSSVAWGAFLAAVLLQCARPLFSLYVLKAVRVQRIYGSLGIVPIFLLWIWLLWIIVLFGAEVAFTIQNVELLRYRDKLHRLSSIYIDRYLAARMMMYVAREFWDTGRPVSVARLATILQITTEETADAAGRLVKLGLLTPVGEEADEFHPARDLSRLELSEVLSIMDRFRDESRSARPDDRAYEDKLEAVFRSAIQAQGQALNGMTFRDLLMDSESRRQDRGDAPPPAAPSS